MSFVKKLPNWLTYLRLALIPLFVLLLVDPTPAMVTAAVVVFIVAACTDYIDGAIARRFGAISDIGKLLDPLADKILVMAGLVMLAAQRSDVYGEPWVPGWMVVLVLAREIWVTGIRGVAAAQGVVVAARGAGKVKSGLQMVAVVLLLLHETQFSVGEREFTCQFIGLNLLLVSIAFSLWGAVEYTIEVLRVPKSEQNTPAQGVTGESSGG